MRRCKLICRWVLITQVMIMLFLAMPPRAVHASEFIYISEIAWAGSSLSSADEWIELVNPSDMDIDVSGWKLVGAGSSGSDIVLPNNSLIPATGALLVANYDAGHQNASITVTPDIVTSTLSLSNSKMLLQLFDMDGVLVDIAGDGGAPFAGFSSDTKASMIRIDSSVLGDGAEVWMTCEESMNMLTDDCGTPGTVYLAVGDEILNQPYAEGTQVQDEVFQDPGEVASSTSTVASSTPLISTTTDDVMVTSTEVISNQIGDIASIATSTEPVVSTSTDMSEPVSAAQPSSFQQKTITRFLRLNEVMAAPESGKEWVELVNLAADRTIVLDGLEIHDSVSRAIKLTGELKPQEKYKVFELSSSKLNNGGDSVYLQTADGVVIDSLTYAGHDKGTSLARDEKMAWQYTNIPTPGGTNLIRMDNETTNQDQNLLIKEDKKKDQEKVIFAVVTSTQATTTLTMTTTIISLDRPEANSASKSLLRLNEIVPNPAEGKEWVEIISYATTSVDLDGLELFDMTGRIYKLDGLIEANGVVYIELASARLNNSGDSVFLQTSDGKVIDELSYEGSQKGYSFARMEDGAWEEVQNPTKGEFNFAGDVNSSNASLVSASSTQTILGAARVSIVSSIKAATNRKSTTKSSSASSATNSNSIISITDYTMLHQEQFGGMRIKLRGTVGTLPKHVSGRGFILLNHDGRGLLIRVPSYKKIPAMGSFLTITGSLKFNTNELPYLSLTKKDDWILEKTERIIPKIRKVSLFAPSAEDAWSLVEAKGVVNSVSGSTVHLIVDDLDVDMKIKSGVNYRASRLNKGDTISVKGILDVSDDIPVILPRDADEIQLISHAPGTFANATEQKEQGIPSWTPFGAAALAVGAVESVKKLKKKLKNREIRKPVLVK